MIPPLRTLRSPQNALRLVWHRSKALAAAIWYGFPARKLTVIGVTGTDGKTTTVGMVTHILHTIGLQVGSLSTACFTIHGRTEWNQTQKTSPSPFIVQRLLHQMKHEGCTHAVLECSSHGLVQDRTLCTWPKVAAITNTSPEHLDYHKSMQQYRGDKGILFQMLRRKGTKVLNADDETYEIYKGISSERTIVYSTAMEQPHIPSTSGGGLGRGGRGIPWTPSSPQRRGENETYLWLSEIQTTPTGISATIHHSYGLEPRTYNLTLKIPGMFNVENALCAIACADAVGIPTQKSIDALRTFDGIPGRMERIDEGQPFTVFVDFTVTPEAYRKTLTTVRSMLPKDKYLLVLTGSCGNRMHEKRPEIGRIVSRFADTMVVTNEDPYNEEPEHIIDEVCTGIDQTNTKAHRIVDRKEAILFLFQKAQPGDIVLLCGKGSDTTMWTKEGQVPWNEREIVREFLQETKWPHP